MLPLIIKASASIHKYGLEGSLKKAPYFIESRLWKLFLYPPYLTRCGVTRKRWEKFRSTMNLIPGKTQRNTTNLEILSAFVKNILKIIILK
jgi:hypothetical protein